MPKGGELFGRWDQSSRSPSSALLIDMRKRRTFVRRFRRCIFHQLSGVDKRDAAPLFCASGTTASTKPAVGGRFPHVAADAAFPPYLFIRSRRAILRRFCILLVVPFSEQVRPFLCDAAQPFGAIRAIGTILSSSTPVGNRGFPFMPLLTLPPNIPSASRRHILRRQVSIFLRMPPGGNGRTAGLQTILFTWPPAGAPPGSFSHTPEGWHRTDSLSSA